MSCVKPLESKGFTLIEIVTVIVVLGILSVFTFRFIDFAVKTYTIGSKQRMLYQEASYIMERITREVRDAQEVHVYNSGTDDSTIRIWPRAHGPGEALLMDQNQYIVFSRDESTIPFRLLRDSATTPSSPIASQIIGSRVTEFKVDSEYCSPNCSGTTDEKGKITITLTLTDTSIPIDDPIAQAVTLTTTISPKNYVTNQYTGRSFNGDYYDVIQ